MFGREPVLWLGALRALIVVAVAFGLEMTEEQTVAVYAAAEALLSLWARSKVTPTRKNAGLPAVTGIVFMLSMYLAGCGSGLGAPVLSTVDAVGRGVSNVLGWCEKAGADETTLARAHRAFEDRDYRAAVALASKMVTNLRESGAAVPEETEVMLRLAEGALAAQAIDAGMSAISDGASG